MKAQILQLKFEIVGRLFFFFSRICNKLADTHHKIYVELKVIYEGESEKT